MRKNIRRFFKSERDKCTRIKELKTKRLFVQEIGAKLLGDHVAARRGRAQLPASRTVSSAGIEHRVVAGVEFVAAVAKETDNRARGGAFPLQTAGEETNGTGF